MSHIVFDIESEFTADEVDGGWNNPAGMGFGLAVAYRYEDDRFHFFSPGQKGQLIQFLKGNTVIGFNSVRYDNAILLGNQWRGRDDHGGWHDVDILHWVCMSRFGCSIEEAEERNGKDKVHGKGLISLDGLSHGTLARHKTGTSGIAPMLIRRGDLAAAFECCLQDLSLIHI